MTGNVATSVKYDFQMWHTSFDWNYLRPTSFSLINPPVKCRICENDGVDRELVTKCPLLCVLNLNYHFNYAVLVK